MRLANKYLLFFIASFGIFSSVAFADYQTPAQTAATAAAANAAASGTPPAHTAAAAAAVHDARTPNVYMGRNPAVKAHAVSRPGGVGGPGRVGGVGRAGGVGGVGRFRR